MAAKGLSFPIPCIKDRISLWALVAVKARYGQSGHPSNAEAFVFPRQEFLG